MVIHNLVDVYYVKIPRMFNPSDGRSVCYNFENADFDFDLRPFYTLDLFRPFDRVL